MASWSHCERLGKGSVGDGHPVSLSPSTGSCMVKKGEHATSPTQARVTTSSSPIEFGFNDVSPWHVHGHMSCDFSRVKLPQSPWLPFGPWNQLVSLASPCLVLSSQDCFPERACVCLFPPPLCGIHFDLGFYCVFATMPPPVGKEGGIWAFGGNPATRTLVLKGSVISVQRCQLWIRPLQFTHAFLRSF